MNKVSYLLASAALVAFAASASATTTEKATTEKATTEKAAEHKAHEGKKHHHKGHKAHKDAAMPADVKKEVAAMQETPKGQEPMVASETSTEQPATAKVEGEKASN